MGGRAARPGAVPHRAADLLDPQPRHRARGAARRPALRDGHRWCGARSRRECSPAASARASRPTCAAPPCSALQRRAPARRRRADHPARRGGGPADDAPRDGVRDRPPRRDQRDHRAAHDGAARRPARRRRRHAHRRHPRPDRRDRPARHRRRHARPWPTCPRPSSARTCAAGPSASAPPPDEGRRRVGGRPRGHGCRARVDHQARRVHAEVAGDSPRLLHRPAARGGRDRNRSYPGPRRIVGPPGCAQPCREAGHPDPAEPSRPSGSCTGRADQRQRRLLRRQVVNRAVQQVSAEPHDIRECAGRQVPTLRSSPSSWPPAAV